MGMSNLHLKQLWQGRLVLCEVPKWGFYSLSPRYVFWIDCCENPHVGRVGMDGQGHAVIVNKEIYSPSALTIDYTNKRIYWADDNHIFFANMDGSQRRRGTIWDVILFLLSFNVLAEEMNIKNLHLTLICVENYKIIFLAWCSLPQFLMTTSRAWWGSRCSRTSFTGLTESPNLSGGLIRPQVLMRSSS